MAYAEKFVRYLNLPKIPNYILKDINLDISKYSKEVLGNESYFWSDSWNEKINYWAQNNICDSVYYAFQMMVKDVPLHRDRGTKVKINYVIETGGKNVVTKFYQDDKHTILDEIEIEPHKWHIFKADTLHCVQGIEIGQTRFAVTGRIFS